MSDSTPLLPKEPPADEEHAAPQESQGILPEPSLKTFVSGLAGQVLINLGLFENPATGRKEVNLEEAKYSIDLLQILHDKMRGNLTDEEEKLMRSILFNIRKRYVEACG